ncbi:hypothetical protein EJB05_31389, partial [Eragrostis curvula]
MITVQRYRARIPSTFIHDSKRQVSPSPSLPPRACGRVPLAAAGDPYREALACLAEGANEARTKEKAHREGWARRSSHTRAASLFPFSACPPVAYKYSPSASSPQLLLTTTTLSLFPAHTDKTFLRCLQRRRREVASPPHEASAAAPGFPPPAPGFLSAGAGRIGADSRCAAPNRPPDRLLRGQLDQIACFMATNNQNQLQLHEMDHIQPVNGQHNEPLHLGQKLLLHYGRDAALRIGPSSHGSMAPRLNDVPSSSRAAQFLSYRVGSSGNSHVSSVHCPSGSSSSHLPEPSMSYPHRSEESVPPVSSHLENRRAAMKRKNPVVHHVDGTNTGGYYGGSSSNAQTSNYVQPSPIRLTETFTQMPFGQSGWDGQQLLQQEGLERNVRARHNYNFFMEPRPDITHAANNIYLPPLRSTASASLSTLVARNQPPISVPLPPRTLPSGAPGTTGRAFFGRTHCPAIGSSNSSVAAAPTVSGSSGNATFDNGGYPPRTVNNVYSHPAPTGPSGSRTVPLETAIRSCPPGFAAATSSMGPSGSRALPLETAVRSYPPGFSATTSASIRIGQPFPTRGAAPSRHARHVAIGHANSGRNRRARSAYYAFHPSMMEAEGLMLDQLIFYESREAADPHRDMRLDVDNMTYEDLLALGEYIGNVNTGVPEDKIAGCVREVVCCSSDPSQNDDDDGTCVVCLEGYKDKDLLGTLKCSHDFHAECIKKWLQVKNSCPVCKAAAA